jgi:hypothetical protein
MAKDQGPNGETQVLFCFEIRDELLGFTDISRWETWASDGDETASEPISGTRIVVSAGTGS